MKKILYGVSGIGNGHANRELPIITELAKDNQIAILCHDDSYATFERYFTDHPNITLIKVDIPFIVGSPEGLNWSAIASHPFNQGKNFLKVDSEALAKVNEIIGIPDLAITDYEPLTAAYAYSHNVPLVTIDQQSKFLFSDLPKELGGFTFEDEVQRLHMFFPKAAARIVCSFFRTKPRLGGDEVHFFPSPIKPSITGLKRNPKHGNEILVYVSSAREFVQTPEEIIKVLEKQTNAVFHLFIKENDLPQYQTQASHIKLYPHGSPEFLNVLSFCDGIISTAGHSLLSEAMYLGIPVYAMPVEPYEQWLNAKSVGDNGFGINHPKFDSAKLSTFITALDKYTQNIREDKNILIRGIGQDLILDYLKRHFLSNKKVLVFSPPFSGHLNILKEMIKDTKNNFTYHLVITGWTNITPDLSGLETISVSILDGGELKETDPALWTFPRAVKLLPDTLKLVDDFKPDVIIYDFFSIEGNLAGRLREIPYWCSIPALIGPNDNFEYCQKKLSDSINQSALAELKQKYGLKIGDDGVEMISDGFHLPGQINLIWSFIEITPSDFMNHRQDLPYVFVGNLRGDNYEKSNYKNNKPLIYFSLGTVVMNNLWNQQADTREKLKKFIKDLSDRWSEKDYQVIFITQGKHVLDKYPQNWWVYDSVDQVEVLSRADVFITHGGSNGFHEAIMQKVPMLLIPFFGDQLLVAQTAEKLGIGLQVGGSSSIDTHSSKDFLNNELVDNLDRRVAEVLNSDRFASQYIEIELSRFPVRELLFAGLPHKEGELVIGSAYNIPKAKEELPIRVADYLELLGVDDDDLPSQKVKNIVSVLKALTAKCTTLADKEFVILNLFSRLYRLHLPLSSEKEPQIEFVKKHLDHLGGSITFYKKLPSAWVPLSKDVVVHAKQKFISRPPIVLTSENPVKLEALKLALGSPLAEQIQTHDPKLDLDEQLVGMDEIIHAAYLRLNETRKTVGSHAVIVSTVSGLIEKSHRFIDLAVVIVGYPDGRYSMSKSKGISLPLDPVQKAKLRNFKKFTVGSMIAEEAGQHGIEFDPHKLLTQGKQSRVKILAAAITDAFFQVPLP